MKAVILGAGGILGHALCRHYQDRGFEYIGLSHRDLDITDYARLTKVLEEYQPETIFNAAGNTAVDLCETHREKAFLINADAPAQLAEFAAKRGFGLVHLSTDYVFDGSKKSPYRETNAMNPLSVYAQSKAEGERRVLQINPKALVVRVGGTFGVAGKTFVCRLPELLMSSQTLRVAHDRIGNCTFAPDLAVALHSLIDVKARGIVHFSNEGSCSLYDFAIQLRSTAEKLGFPVQTRDIVPIESTSLHLAARRPMYSVLDTNLYRQITGNGIRHWHETLREFLEEVAEDRLTHTLRG